LFAQVEQDLGAHWVGVLQRAVAEDRGTIDADIVAEDRAPATADAGAKLEPVAIAAKADEPAE
jgi:hypothetical protein